MGREKTYTPKLIPRQETGVYYFYWWVNGFRKAITTKTTELDAAKEYRKKFIQAEGATALAIQHGENVYKIANIFAQSATGEPLTRLSFPEAWAFWTEHNPEFKESSARHQEQMYGYFKRFAEWCQRGGIQYLENVDNSAAIRYHVALRSDNNTIKTVNEHLRFLSRVFRSIDVFRQLPNRNPFAAEIVKPSAEPRVPEASHLPLEPEMVEAVMKGAAEVGQTWLDLFVVSMQTGMRLKDATLFRWEMIKDGFIEFEPEKTMRYGNKARLPVSPLLNTLLVRRKVNNFSPYVNPEIAALYLASDRVTKKSKAIFEKALGKANTQLDKTNRQRKRNGCTRSFHSFRVTFMSLLAAKQVPLRDAMTMLGWESVEMIQLYSKMLEQAKGDMDKRNKTLLENMPELNISLPEVETAPERLKPTKAGLEKLIQEYSNQTIGLIYGISNVAVKNWMDKFGLLRCKRIESPELTESEILKIREELQAA